MDEDTKNGIIGLIAIIIVAVFIFKGCNTKVSKESFAEDIKNNPQNILNINTLEDMRKSIKRAPNDLQESKISERIENYISGKNVVSWRGKITKLDKYELKIYSNGVTFYHSINSDIENMVGNIPCGTRVIFSGKVYNKAFISYEMDFVSIYKDTQYHIIKKEKERKRKQRDALILFEKKKIQKHFTEYIIRNLDLYYRDDFHREQSRSIQVEKKANGRYYVYRGLMISRYFTTQYSEGTVKGREYKEFYAVYEKDKKNNFKLISFTSK